MSGRSKPPSRHLAGFDHKLCSGSGLRPASSTQPALGIPAFPEGSRTLPPGSQPSASPLCPHSPTQPYLPRHPGPMTAGQTQGEKKKKLCFSFSFSMLLPSLVQWPQTSASFHSESRSEDGGALNCAALQEIKCISYRKECYFCLTWQESIS